VSSTTLPSSCASLCPFTTRAPARSHMYTHAHTCTAHVRTPALGHAPS
jgi:hypothetical protein